ncbi:MAG: hypothetical protein J2P17_24235, partial [Mycobacterium sp.]|nr:hypothetical protein [Mycobacterium sp.]
PGSDRFAESRELIHWFVPKVLALAADPHVINRVTPVVIPSKMGNLDEVNVVVAIGLVEHGFDAYGSGGEIDVRKSEQ